MSTDLVKVSPADIEKVIIGGDLSKLSPQERTSYYMSVCESLNLNPLTKPFEYINLNGKLTLYATRNCAEQLRKNNGVSVTEMTQQTIGDVLVDVRTFIGPRGDRIQVDRSRLGKVRNLSQASRRVRIDHVGCIVIGGLEFFFINEEFLQINLWPVRYVL